MKAPAGLLLAAGAGTRMGRPKALLRDPGGTAWLRRSAAVLHEGGCDPVTVVLGAAAEEARPLVPSGMTVVVADDWAEGMAASLRAGLASMGGEPAVVVSLVDLPDVTAEVVRRVIGSGVRPGSLRRATYGGRPGHPAVLGRDHWPGILDSLKGDTGAREYLAAHDVESVECGDLATGHDLDRRPG